MMRLLIFMLCFFTVTACASEQKKGDETNQTAISAQVDKTGQGNTLDTFFNKTDAFLSANIESGKVPYEAIKSKPARLNELVKLVGTVSLDDATNAEKKAFYINAYNILTINSIIENGIPASPMDIDGFFDGIKHDVAGKKMTLDDLEKGTLFPEFGDARMHFAVVCAALGCPQLQPEAYMPGKLDKQLDHATKETLNRDYFIRVENGKNTVKISELFKWYKDDFLKEADSVLAYINQFRDKKIPSNYTVEHYDYDWSLNDVEG